jgi:carbonic anhydrase
MAQTYSKNSLTKKSFDKLIHGVHQFRTTIYPQRKELYEASVRDGQSPHALFITCADSRIDPELLTQSGHGDIFVLRNIGNMVPSYGEMLGGVSSVIEYAVTGLNVDQVVICGHSDCGAVKGLLDPTLVSEMPTVRSWLRNGEAALKIANARARAENDAIRLSALVEENVLLQLRHLQTHPSVAGRLADRTLIVSGWIYEIALGTVRIYNEQQDAFLPSDSYLKGDGV